VLAVRSRVGHSGRAPLDDQLLEVQGGEQRTLDSTYNPTDRTSGENELTDIDTIPAGQEVDALIAEKVFGGPGKNVQWYWWRNSTPSLDVDPPIYAGPAFSTDIAAAWRVVEKMKECHWFLLTDRIDTKWYAAFSDKAKSIESSAPLAICRAALKAI
jgi:hypothetical protein